MALLIVAGLPMVAAQRAEAQVLTGRVLAGTDERPIGDAAVTLLAADGRELVEPVGSDSDGRFTLRIPGPGSYYLRAERLGYRTVVDGIFDFASEAGRMPVNVYMRPAPVELEPLDVRVERANVRRHLQRAGFYDRAARGFGTFIPPEVIEERPEFNVSDYMRGVPGVVAQNGRVLWRNPALGPNRPELCEPTFWVDGIRMVNGSQTPGGAAPGDGLDDRVRAEDVTAIEVYRRRMEVPMEYYVNEPSLPFCGAIVIWTRAGR